MKLYILTIILISCTLIANAQITAPGSSATRYTDYSTTSDNDPIFIFCHSDAYSSATLNATSPGGTGPFDFTWTRWDELTSDFTISVGQYLGVMNSQITDLDEGGYRVEITDGASYDTSLIAWVHIDKPVSIAKLNDFKCNYVALSGYAAIDTFNYADINSGSSIMLPNDYSFEWSSEPESSIPYPTLEINPQTFDPPLVDVWYNLHVVDSFGCTSDSSFFYESIHVKADFDVDPTQGEAPLEVFITDNSIRASTYIWEFGDDSVSYMAEPFSHTYYFPGTYKMSLYIESDQFCKDSTSVNITVEPSSLNIPNVFSPDGDGINDFFYVENKSLRSIFVQVFSKGGQRVYVFDGQGDALKDWQGWDGYIGGSKASPGVYFYIIRARGWDDVVYEGKEYRGFLYLYR
ncbi:MAG: gliding motility-associated C-terminal domain-containing protein [Bacteroidota bacterium]